MEFSDETKYRLIRPIAAGGMGEVYEAVQIGVDSFEKQVAIKIIREEYANLPEFRRNFVGEARLVADLIHPNVVQTYHLGRGAKGYYIVMEYVHGSNLETFILQHRALKLCIPPKIAGFMISRICRGLSYAHNRRNSEGTHLNIVHRDINPKNVLIGVNGDVKLTDFGIAKAFNLMYNKEGDVIAGKDEYLSPEQAEKKVTDCRSDVFSCGIVLAEMICGQNIFDTGVPEMTRANILNMHVPDLKLFNPEIPDELEAIACKALEKDPSERYQSCAEMMTALEYFLYRKGYGPTHEKLSSYLEDIFSEGLAYEDDRLKGFTSTTFNQTSEGEPLSS